MNKAMRRVLAIIFIIVLLLGIGYLQKEDIIMSFNKQLDKPTKKIMKKKLSFMEIKNIVFSKKDLSNFKEQIVFDNYSYQNEEYYEYFNEISKADNRTVVDKAEQYVKEDVSLKLIKDNNKNSDNLKMFKEFLEKGIYGNKNTLYVVNPDNKIAIASKDRFIYQYEPKSLVNIDNVPKEDKGVYLATSETAQALQRMCKAMKAANNKECGGVVLTSSYRSYADQEKLYNQMVNEDASNSEYVNKAGESEHQLGNSIDLVVKNKSNKTFQNSAQYRWLLKNAATYGFILRYPKDKEKVTGIAFEAWHFRYVGEDIAKKMSSSNQVLEEYYEEVYK